MDASKGTNLEFPSWTFLTNHAHVLLCIAADPEVRLRDVASRVGITERAVQRIVSDLEEGGYLQREREGRRNHYTVRADLPLRHPVERHRSVASLIALVEGEDDPAPAPSRKAVRPKR
ncbi:helix-turn-helix transcriptional regulator [Myxococcus vastator]|uniref:helix-turn-helix transcriptional regulator n=1 Tax=Myxococcus vastator TaxID=2709664 RepID=UPI0013D02C24|nr:MarR family transcriptional regulator [Myxococcus vastator]